jgi:catechol 2,3-dioxygenase-like lactoylglutathione lyase family enzyme
MDRRRPMTGRELTFRPKALTIACTDLDRSRRFYEDVLGASPDPRDGYGCPWYRLGAWYITLMPNAAERSPSSFPDHAMVILWLEVDDLEDAVRLFARHQVEVVQPSDGQFMMIADPDGLMIEVWQSE